MSTYAVLNGGVIVAERVIADWESYPAHKKAALDERGDGGPTLRPIVIEGEGSIEAVTIEATRVVKARSHPPPPPPPTVEQLKAMIDAEWSRRVFGEFVFQGETYHADRDSVDNIIGAASMAQEAIGLGVQAGNRYWHYPDPSSPPEGATEFAWKSKSNGMIPMDAPAVVALAKALFAHKHSHFLAARALKEMDPIPDAHELRQSGRWP